MNMNTARTALVARAIERDLLREAEVPAVKTSTCHCCGRGFAYHLPTGDDSGRFCSLRCRQAYDDGGPRYADLSTSNDWINVDLSKCIQIAGPAIPRCDSCGGLCVELYRKAGKAFCRWRCRDGKPRECIACGVNLYGIARRGPYCSEKCANEPRRKRQKATYCQTAK